MQNTQLEVLSQTLSWLEQGQQVTLVTLVKTLGTTARPVGALLAILKDRQMIGSVSGGCLEDDLVDRVLSGEFHRPTRLTYTVTTTQSQCVGLPCGGTIELILEPLSSVESIKPALIALQARQLIARQLDLKTGKITWQNTPNEQTVYYDDQQFIMVYEPSWQLLIIGAGQIARYLSQFALALDYQVIVCEPRSEYCDTWQIAGTQQEHCMPDQAVMLWAQDQRSAVVTLSKEAKLDDLALLEALNSPAFYVGALGSKKSQEKRCKRLKSLDLSETALAKLHAPVGLSIGSHTPAEIALAILAEITAVRNHPTGLQPQTSHDNSSTLKRLWHYLKK
jgi:xanthine dehydrogenase accessory factor